MASPRLLEFPPLFAIEVQLNLLLAFDVLVDVTLWHRTASSLDCILSLGDDGRPTRRVRPRPRPPFASARVSRCSEAPSSAPCLSCATESRTRRSWAVSAPQTPEIADAFLGVAATSLGPAIEREHLLEHSAARRADARPASERRLMRLGFDLHDGPIQDVLALAADVRLLQEQVYPFVLERHREQAVGRFDDLTARLVGLDRDLREIAHSLETKSVISRPLGEILHRELDTFTERTGITASLEIRGEADSLTSAQRITVFRAIQEALANVREHLARPPSPSSFALAGV